MFLKRVRILFQAFLALAVALSPTAQAERPATDPAVIAQVEMGQGPSQVHLEMRALEAGEQTEVLEEALRNHPQAPVTVIYGNEGPAVDPQVLSAAQEIGDPSRLQLVRANVAAIAKRTNAVIEDIEPPTSHPNHELRLSKKVGFLFTIMSAASFTTSFYLSEHGVPSSFILLKHDLPMLTMLFGVASVVNGFQILGMPYWHKYLQFGGQTATKVWRAITQALGRSIGDGQTSDSVGRILAVLGFNVGVTSTVLAIRGALDESTVLTAAGSILLVAGAAGWDINWDSVWARLIDKGIISEKFLKAFVVLRLTFGPWLDGRAMSGSPSAMAFATAMGAIGFAGAVTLFSLDKVLTKFKEAKARREQTGSRSLWQKAKDKFHQLTSCQELLL